MEGKEIVVFSKDKNPVRCEEGLNILPDKSLDEFVIDEYDCILLSAMGMAFREFAIAITRKLGYECEDGSWGEIKYPINPDDYIFRADA